jgi:hypothetical protein
MEDIKSVLTQFVSRSRSQSNHIQKASVGPFPSPSFAEIPEVFFDHVLLKFKLNRHEISLLLYLYRQVWCRPNLYKSHGIGPLNSYAELSSRLEISNEELGTYLRNLENFGLLETVRSGQYFIRKYFTEYLDLEYGQNYDEFF